MNPARVGMVFTGLILLIGLSACSRDRLMAKCDEPEPYQSVVAGKRVVVPDSLDPLNEMAEMPIPKSQTPPRAEDAGCLEKPPAIGAGG